MNVPLTMVAAVIYVKTRWAVTIATVPMVTLWVHLVTIVKVFLYF